MTNLKQQFSDNLLTTSRHEIQSSNPIPVDLLIDIFSRVPGESIARFRCVSKFWASLLRRPDFTELFMTQSLTRPRILFTLEADGKLFFYSSPQPHNPNDNSSLVATPYHRCPEYIISDIPCKTVCGLVLLQEVGVICNPATGGFITLPKVKAKSNPMKTARMCIGYDPIGKQFKVLCMTLSRNERPTTHQVLTLESGKRLWRPVEHEFHFVENDKIRGEICINGVLYFGAEMGRSCVIVCFDVRSEKLGFINTELELGSSYTLGSLTLFNYKGRLGIHHGHWDLGFFGPEEIVLWVLEDAGNHKWSKRTYPLCPLRHNSRFVGMTGTSEIVWWSCEQPFYFLFNNLEGNTITRVKIQGLDEFKHHRLTHHTFLDYVENVKFM